MFTIGRRELGSREPAKPVQLRPRAFRSVRRLAHGEGCDGEEHHPSDDDQGGKGASGYPGLLPGGIGPVHVPSLSGTGRNRSSNRGDEGRHIARSESAARQTWPAVKAARHTLCRVTGCTGPASLHQCFRGAGRFCKARAVPIWVALTHVGVSASALAPPWGKVLGFFGRETAADGCSERGRQPGQPLPIHRMKGSAYLRPRLLHHHHASEDLHPISVVFFVHST